MTEMVLRVSDKNEDAALCAHLRRTPGVDAHAAAVMSPDFWGFLQVAAASSGALAVAIKTLPEFIRSRRTDISIAVRIKAEGSKEIEITAANAEDAIALIEKALDL